MTTHFRLLALLAVAASAPLAGQDPPPDPSRGFLARGTWAIIGADVIPMTSDTVIRNATVLVRDGRIVAVGPRGSVRVPSGAGQLMAQGR